MTELETLRKVLDTIRLGLEATEAIWNFCEWLTSDPKEAARVAKSRATGMAAGKAAHAAAKSAGPKRKR